jgi:hypothetical protein
MNWYHVSGCNRFDLPLINANPRHDLPDLDSGPEQLAREAPYRPLSANLGEREFRSLSQHKVVSAQHAKQDPAWNCCPWQGPDVANDVPVDGCICQDAAGRPRMRLLAMLKAGFGEAAAAEERQISLQQPVP